MFILEELAMTESQIIPAKISIDDQGRVVITDPQLAEALKGVAEPPQRLVAANNNVTQCGCNLVAGCG
jgi:hypothetical protein